jgi:hypothetical protein
MSLLEELNTIVESAGFPVETGVFTKAAPDVYVVITPISEHFELFADNAPGMSIEEARLSLFSKGNYVVKKNLLVRMFLSAGYLVTERRYIGYEEETGYHHFAIDVAKEYMEDD